MLHWHFRRRWIAALCALLVCAVPAMAQDTATTGEDAARETAPAPAPPPPSAPSPAIPVSGRISFSADAPDSAYPANAEIELTVTLSWTGREDDYRLDRIEPPDLTNLLILGSGTETVKEVSGTASTYHHVLNYRLRPEAEGRASVGPAAAYYRSRGSEELRMVSTQRIELEVTPPEYGFFEVERNVKLVAFAGGLVALAFVLLGLRYAILRRVRARRAAAIPPEAPPLEQCQENLMFAAGLLEAGEHAAFYAAVAEAIQTLTRRVFRLPAKTRTTQDFLAHLETIEVDEKAMEQTREVLESCDYARFTGKIPTHTEGSNLLTLAREAALRISRSA